MPSKAISGTPAAGEIIPFHLRFLEMFPGDDIAGELVHLTREAMEVLASIPPEKETFRYAPGKWSVREMVGHVSDTERILCVRLLAASRGDLGNLPGFDENLYSANSGHDGMPLADLVEEFTLVRKSTMALLAKLDHDQWRRTTLIRGFRLSARGMAWSIAGHSTHHIRFLREHYL